MDKEQWLPVVGYEGHYSVSNYGRVRSEARRVPHGKGGATRLLKEKILNPGYHLGGYPQYSLHMPGVKPAKSRAGVLVLEAFVGPRPENMVTRHLDGDPMNNRLDNLAWGTQSENMLDRRRHGTSDNGFHASKTHCPRGHHLSGNNLRTSKTERHGRTVVGRGCRSCDNAHTWVADHPETEATVQEISDKYYKRYGSDETPGDPDYWRPKEKTHCPRGHLYQEPNLKKHKTGAKVCKSCSNAQSYIRRHPDADLQREADIRYERIMSGTVKS